MINLPIFCSSCGAIFPSGILVDNFNNNALKDTNGHCPFCGGFGQVSSDMYNFIGQTIETLTSPGKTIDEINSLSLILRNYKDKESGISELRQQIEREVPQLASITNLLPETHQNIYQLIQIILFIITIVITLTLENPGKSITAEIIISQLYKYLTPAVSEPGKDEPKKNFKIGRNELCFCGSGKKYKKCCGQAH